MALAALHVIVLVWWCMVWYYIIRVSVMHVLNTPRFDTERQEWSEDTMRFDTVVY